MDNFTPEIQSNIETRLAELQSVLEGLFTKEGVLFDTHKSSVDTEISLESISNNSDVRDITISFQVREYPPQFSNREGKEFEIAMSMGGMTYEQCSIPDNYEKPNYYVIAMVRHIEQSNPELLEKIKQTFFHF